MLRLGSSRNIGRKNHGPSPNNSRGYLANIMTNSEQTMDSLRSLSSPTAAVLRDGIIDHIPSKTVVPGDIVELKTGDVVPADLRLFDVMNFETDEALLTGESLPVMKDPLLDLNGETGVGDRINMAFSSSTVTKGRARGIVTGTGMATEIGAIAASLSGKSKNPSRSMSRKKYGTLQPVKGAALNTWDALGRSLGLTVGTPLQRKLSKLAYVLLFCAILLAIIVFGVNKFNVTHEVTIYAISLGTLPFLSPPPPSDGCSRLCGPGIR